MQEPGQALLCAGKGKTLCEPHGSVWEKVLMTLEAPEGVLRSFLALLSADSLNVISSVEGQCDSLLHPRSWHLSSCLASRKNEVTRIN